MGAERSSRWLLVAASSVGVAMYVGLRVPSLIEINDLGAVGEHPSQVGWLMRAVPITLIAYVAAAIPGIQLARDGVARWCWIPASMLFVLGPPLWTWLGWDPVIVDVIGTHAGIAVDLVAVLLPAGAAGWTAQGRRPVDRARLVGAALVFTFLVAWQVPRAISETGEPMAVIAFLLSFAALWRVEGVRRTIAFSVIALAVSRFGTILIFEGLEATAVAFRESTGVMAVAAVCLLITPIARILRRRSDSTRDPVPAT